MNTLIRSLPLGGLLLSACNPNMQGGRDMAQADLNALPRAEASQCMLLGDAAPENLQHFRGTMHEHSSYSDGDIYSIPADYYAAARSQGLDFVGGSEHSDSLDDGNFVAVGGGCLGTPDGLLTCLSPQSDESLAKWETTAMQANAASNAGFLAIRGFEWTSDRFGHINVYFSHNFTNAKTDQGYTATMESFWQWFSRSPSNSTGLGGSATSPVPFGGGSDGLAHFNHPSDKCLSGDDPGCNWNDYTLIPEAVERMFGMELYNGGGRDSHYPQDYVRALDKGWMLAPVGSEDEHGTEWGNAQLAKTVTLASDLSPAAFRQAWLARRSYALLGNTDLRVHIRAAGQPMGSRFQCAPGSSLNYQARVEHADGSAFAGSLKLIGPAGEVLAETSGDTLELSLLAGERSQYAFLQVSNSDGESIAYAAPIWMQP